MSVTTILQSELEWLKDSIIERMRAEGITVTGKTAESLESVVKSSTNMTVFWAILKGRPAFSTVEDGRRPGGVPSNIESIIKRWIQDKGISIRQIPYVRQPSERWQPKYTVQERSLNIAAGAIAHTIKTKGTRLFRQGGRKDIYTPLIDEFIERVSEKVSKECKIEIVERV